MAQDENEPPRLRGPPPGATAPPDHVKNPQIYEIFHGSKAEGDSAQQDGSTPTGAEGQKKTPNPTFTDGLQSIQSTDFLNIHKVPCAREGFITGIGAGAAVGVGSYLVGGRIPRAANWAAGTFLLGSIIQWEYCQAQRRKERAAMARVVEVVDRKKAEKEAKAAEALRSKQEADEKAQQAKKSWYKIW
ncbi:Uu.00g144670.m01.CDS01 [Anthostomella pinea]|uniref:Cytochrome c oxidase assembly protein COX20, mitochondrial n=1 Tax=Anthostomella pinea TaxID=933095 RepID=A0AAI8VQZ5_9PEZI|nr:Uu.00g144670.m01.CDS01 [Anthostomella pinea]